MSIHIPTMPILFLTKLFQKFWKGDDFGGKVSRVDAMPI
jgi:hypothetical protein